LSTTRLSRRGKRQTQKSDCKKQEFVAKGGETQFWADSWENKKMCVEKPSTCLFHKPKNHGGFVIFKIEKHRGQKNSVLVCHRAGKN